MSRQKITFTGSGGNVLAAILELPESDNPPIAFALFAHCFTCNKNLSAIRNISKALLSNNIAVMRFDFTGLGESEGDFANTNFSSNVEDLVFAARYLEQNHRPPSILIGHSLGGAAVINASTKIESVQAVVTIGAPCSPEHVSNIFKSGIEEINKNGFAEVNIGGRSFTIQKQFLDDIEEKNMDTIIHDMKKPILIFHSPQDEIVGIENAAHIFKSALHPKSFISLDGADHLLSNPKDSKYVGQMIATWASRYLQVESASQ